jgi:uncharacterized protein (DUF885 family)
MTNARTADSDRPEGRDEAALELTGRFWEQFLELEPIMATEIGDERFDDQLPDPSEEGVAKQLSVYRSALKDTEAFGRDGLSELSRTSLDVMEGLARRQLLALEHRMDRFVAVAHLFGPSGLLADLGVLQRADTPERLERYVRRLRAVPGFLAALGEVAEGGIPQGQVMPALVVDRTIAQVERLLEGDPAESPAMSPVPESDSEGRERALEALREAVWPGFQGYLDMLRRYRLHARDSIGLLALPDGDAMYAAELLSYTTLPLEAQAVHDIGQEQLARIQEERGQIARSLGFDSAEAALEAYRETGQNTATTRQEFLKIVEDQVERGWEAAPRYFGRLPQANCLVRMVEEFREDDMPGAFYMPPSGDGSRLGVYYVNTSDVRNRPLHHTASTSYHEANPGHHFQISIEQEYSDRPPLRRFGGGYVSTAFTEGWGLYSERLADEMGLFLSEYERLGMLEAQGLRAGRLIVDTGIHALGWDRERAVKQMEVTGASPLDAAVEVDRYVAMPGQACAYMIGQLEIQRWRAAAEERDGGRFSLAGFHDRLLALGALPLRTLERELAQPGS